MTTKLREVNINNPLMKRAPNCAPMQTICGVSWRPRLDRARRRRLRNNFTLFLVLHPENVFTLARVEQNNTKAKKIQLLNRDVPNFILLFVT